MFAALLLSIGCGRMNHQVTAEAAPAPENLAKATPLHSIIMPHDEPELPPGAGREQFVTQCIICHSPRYITSQPAFSRKVWAAEVTKMVKVYGAHATPEDQTQIVEYLVALNGVPSEQKQ